MSEYLTYTLWRQREQTLLHQLERQRVVEERLTQHHLHENQVRPEQQLPGPAMDPAESVEESAERVSVNEAHLDRVT